MTPSPATVDVTYEVYVVSSFVVTVLAEVGVALLLFHIGLEFSFENMKGIRVVGVLGGLIQVAATIAAGMGVGRFLGWSFEQQLVLGAAVALSSTAIVLSVLSSKHMLHSPAGRLSIAILIFQDLTVVPMIIVIKFFAGAKAGGAAAETLAWAAARLVFSPAGCCSSTATFSVRSSMRLRARRAGSCSSSSW